jgi:YggT family protein
MVVQAFFYIIYGALFIRVILSWLNLNSNPFSDLIYAITEPILGPIRNVISKSPLGGPDMMLDLSPIAAFLLISFARNLLLGILR